MWPSLLVAAALIAVSLWSAAAALRPTTRALPRVAGTCTALEAAMIGMSYPFYAGPSGIGMPRVLLFGALTLGTAALVLGVVDVLARSRGRHVPE